MRPGARLEAFLGVTDLDRAREFYGGVLGLAIVETNDYGLVLDGGGTTVRLQRLETAPALAHTVLGWVVPDLAATVGELRAARVSFTRYDCLDQDDHDVWTAPGGDQVAWFTDPDGNVLSLQQPG